MWITLGSVGGAGYPSYKAVVPSILILQSDKHAPAEPWDFASRAFGSKFRAITRVITPGQPGGFTVTHGQSTRGNPSHPTDKTAGQTRSDLRWKWWPGAGSNRRPSDFQDFERGPRGPSACGFVLSRRPVGPVVSTLHEAGVSKTVSRTGLLVTLACSRTRWRNLG